MKAGGLSKVEIDETRDRIEDSLFAVRAGLAEGYIAGGGVPLYNASQRLTPETRPMAEQIGIKIVKEACKEPGIQIIQNATGSRSKAIQLLSKLSPENPQLGYNSKTLRFENLLESGVIDPL